MKKPMLAVGILFMSIFLLSLTNKGKSLMNRENLIPTSCRAALVKLDRRIPATWKTECEKNNMVININTNYLRADGSKFDIESLRPVIYRDLANNLTITAKNSPSDNLERVDFIRVHVNHPQMKVNALTEGKYLVKLATIRSKKLIKDHLKATVQVQEIIKDRK